MSDNPMDRRFLAAICTCGHPVILAVKDHIEGMSDEFAQDMLKACLEGCDLRHITYAEFRALPDLGCTCNDQPTLFDSALAAQPEEAGT